MSCHEWRVRVYRHRHRYRQEQNRMCGLVPSYHGMEVRVFMKILYHGSVR